VVTATVVVLVLLVVGWLGVRGLLARHRLTTARADLTAARHALLEGRLADADARIRSSSKATSSASSLTGDPIWRAAGHLPAVGRSFVVTHAVADGANRLAHTVLPDAYQAARVLDPAHVRRPDGTIDLDRVTKAAPRLRSASAEAIRVDGQIRALPTGGVGPVSHARTQLAHESANIVSALSGGVRAVELAPALLGADRPRSYFVLVQQYAESRGTGGLTGGFAVLRFDHGHVAVTAQGSNADLSAAPVDVPSRVSAEWVAHYRPLSAFQNWLGVNVSPNLPVVSRVIAARWKQQSGQSVDGVVALDAQALSDILQGSKPIRLPNGSDLAARDIIPYLSLYQYAGYPAPHVSDQANSSGPRKQLLSAISRAATDRLMSGGGDTSALMRGVISAIQSGHLRMASDDPELQGGLHEAGIDGALPSGPAPVAYPVVFNSAGGKLDYFLDRSIRYAATCAGGRRHSTITVELTNRAPATGLPPYVTTRFDAEGVVSSTDNRDTLVVYGTRGAVLKAAHLGGRSLIPYLQVGPYLASFTEEGLPAWSILLPLPRDKTQRLVLDLEEPAVRGAVRIPEQPLARPLQVRTDVRC
jgi:hypothetical protein